MKKEEILESLKSSILTLRDKGRDLAANPEMFKAWKKENAVINEAINKLDSSDILWLKDEYSKWSDEVIKPEIDKLPAALKKQYGLA